MLHGMGRPAESLHVRVSKDTVREENGLGELGKGLLIPAEPLELKLNMHGPAPRPIHAHAMKFQHALWVRDGALTSDLGKSSQIGTIKAHELGWGTWSRRRDGHCYRMRVLVREAFWEAK